MDSIKRMRGRRAKKIEHEDTHRWMVSYADFITLLFAFFVVMYAISSVNVSKYKTLADGMQSAFNQNGKQKAPMSNRNDGQSGGAIDVDAFNDLEQKLAELQDSDYSANRQNGWIELDIKAEALFDSGSAELRPLAVIKLMKLANILKKVPFPIALEGYTDNLPISTPQYPSNWELSAARAAAVARILTNYGVDPGRITVTGYGEQFPVADNISDDGRAKNRRVNLIIAKDKTIPRLLNPAEGKNQFTVETQKNNEPPLSLQPKTDMVVPLAKETP
ncbi:flagellar motor protein MotB [Legionella genomosp. 1]|uniref:flagellar motor protein MotB n=1 Tax=Legionella genomosp. 1 TaxID=1093625 RepID=UPI0021CB2578